MISETDANGGALTGRAAEWNEINPFRYRGYYYDAETGLYYLQSRYYDAEVGRFINSDGFVSTGQGILGTNMFTYCGNNPVNREDNTGLFWKSVGTLIKKAWNGFKTWVSNTFGGNSSVVYEDKAEYECSPVPLNYIITIKEGTKTTTTVSKTGNDSKPITVYNQKRSDDIMLSSAGFKVNAPSFSLDMSLCFEDIGLSGLWNSQGTVNSISITADITQLKFGIERSTTVVASWDSNTTITEYTNVSISMWAMMAFAYAIAYGQMPSDVPARTPEVVPT